MIHPRELPAGWGLLETDARSPALTIRHEAPAHTPSERHLLRTLRNIAAAATRDHRRAVIRRAITPGAPIPGRDAPTPVPSITPIERSAFPTI
jgi:hypothetical protein